MKKTALLLIMLTIISKFMGFFREIILAYYYGASTISDAYVVSLTVPTIIFTFVGSGLALAYIPIYTNIERSEGIDSAHKFTSQLASGIVIFCSIIFIFIGYIFNEQVVRFFASGLTGEALTMASEFTRISSLGIFFTLLVALYSAYLQINGSYAITALIGLPMNGFIVVSIILSSRGDYFILPYGIVAALFSQLVLLIPFILKKGYRFSVSKKVDYIRMKNAACLSIPIIIGVALNDINSIMDRKFVAEQTIGGISALNYAQRLIGFVQGIVVISIATAAYPLMSRMVGEQNIKRLKETIAESMIGVCILVAPCTIGIMALARPLIDMLFGRGAFNQDAIQMTSSVLFFYAIGMVGMGMREILSRPFYAYQDVKTPAINAGVGAGLNIILNIILSPSLGIRGLALGTSISTTISAGIMFIILRRKIGAFGIYNFMISFTKVLAASILMGLVTRFTYNQLSIVVDSFIALSLSILIGGITYLYLIYLFKLKELHSLVNDIISKMKPTLT